MASYLSLNPQEAYNLGGKFYNESNLAKKQVVTYGVMAGPWASNHGVTYRNTTGFSGNTRVVAKADVYRGGTPTHTDKILTLGNGALYVAQGRYAMAGPLSNDSTSGSYQNAFPFHVASFYDQGGGYTVPNPNAHGEITTQGEFSYGGITFTYTETESATPDEYPVMDGCPADKGYMCPSTKNTVRISNCLEIKLDGADITALRGKKYGFIVGNSPYAVTCVANQSDYSSGLSDVTNPVGTAIIMNGFHSASSTSYTKIQFPSGWELPIPPQTAVDCVGCHPDGFMVKFKSNATANDYGYEVLPFSYTFTGTTYWVVIKITY